MYIPQAQQSTVASGCSRVRSPTIFDVAELAGVNFRTVSRAFARSGPVAAKTRKRILAAAAKLCYCSNLVARGLAKAKTQTIGLLVASIFGRFLHQSTLETVAGDSWGRGYKVIVLSHQHSRQKEDHCIRELLSHKVDGIVIFPGHDGPSEMLRQLAESRVPDVTIDSQHNLPIPGIRVDREHGAYLQFQHLLELGRKRLALYVSGPAKASRPVDARMEGYGRAFKKYGMDFDEQLLLVDRESRETSFDQGRGVQGFLFAQRPSR